MGGNGKPAVIASMDGVRRTVSLTLEDVQMRGKVFLAAALAAGAWVAAPAQAGDTIRLGGVGSLTTSRDFGARVQNLDTKVGTDAEQTAYHGGGHSHGGSYHGGYHGGGAYHGGYHGGGAYHGGHY